MEAKQSSARPFTQQSTLGERNQPASALCCLLGAREKEPLLAAPPLSPPVLLISENHETAHKEICAEGPGGQRKRRGQ